MSKFKEIIKSPIDKCRKLSVKTRIQIICAVASTAALGAAITSYAWFNNQKKAAEMYKIKYPNSLYINAAHREDQMYFDLGEINISGYWKNAYGEFLDSSGNVTENPEDAALLSYKQYVFSVSGSNTETYKLKLAHTTNNPFTYKIFKAEQLDSDPKDTNNNANDKIIIYRTHLDSHSENPLTAVSDDVIDDDSETEFYYVRSNLLSGSYLNDLNNDGKADKVDSNNQPDSYYAANYGGLSNSIHQDAIPLYWQSESCETENDSNKRFCDYYIIQVEFSPSHQEDNDEINKLNASNKETDLVYLSVIRD